MKEETKVLKIFHLSHPLITTEWLSVLGDKYQKSLAFNWSIVTDLKEADVVVWDGVITPKLSPMIQPLMEEFKQNKILLLVGEALTSLRQHPMVKLASIDDLRYVEISGWSILPEEILAALEACNQKVTHV